MKTRSVPAAMLILAAVGFAPVAAPAQVIHHHYYPPPSRPWAANVVVPQTRAYVAGPIPAPHVTPAPARTIEITGVEVGVVILEQVATTTMDISLRNLTGSRQEAEMLVPVPAGAVIRAFTFQGAAAEPTAELLPKDQARGAYAAIVAKVRDPALLEFVGYQLVRSCVFPLDPRGTQKVRLTYEHLLPADGNRLDYELPRSESLEYNVPWTVSVRIKSKRPISTVYSPTHALETRRLSDGAVSVRLTPDAMRQPGPVRLSYLLDSDGMSASLVAYPDPKTGGGYFLLLAAVPAKPLKDGGRSPIQREVTLVLDRSGSMRGEKIEQVREAVLQVLAGLDDGEAFNIIVYNEAVELFAPRAVLKDKTTLRKAEEFLRNVQPRGGTNLHDALVEALRAKPEPGLLPIVLFLTDGLPTIGQTSEAAIRDVALKANPHQRRIFTFGVGLDVNTPLLEKVAAETRATATFVLPKEDVEVKVGQVFKRLAGPVLADPALEIVDVAGRPALGRVTDLIPGRLPDLFEDDQVVLLGRYMGEEPIGFRLTGNYLGRTRTFRFQFDLDGATTRNAFVPRLWASRKIALLLDAIRQMGAAPPGGGVPGTPLVAAHDPRLKELVDEVIRLSLEFGILTEYTAFLAREGTDLSRRDEVLAEAVRNFQNRAIQTRVGLGSMNQEFNLSAQRAQAHLNARNDYYDQQMNRVEISAVQQVNDRTFYRRGDRWVDSRLVNDEARAGAAEVVEFDSEAYYALVRRLAAENRAGTVAQRGDVLMMVDQKPVLVKGPSGN